MNEFERSVLQTTLELAKLLEDGIIKQEIISNIQVVLDENVAE